MCRRAWCWNSARPERREDPLFNVAMINPCCARSKAASARRFATRVFFSDQFERSF
jgi:hypothetical protein